VTYISIIEVVSRHHRGCVKAEQIYKKKTVWSLDLLFEGWGIMPLAKCFSSKVSNGTLH
jgi:hypothetical protein